MIKEIRELDTDVQMKMDFMLANGKSVAKVADYLQNELGLFNDMRRASVRRGILRYKSTDLKKRILSSEDGDRVLRADPKKVNANVSVLTEQEDLIQYQIKRLDKLKAEAEKTPLAHMSAIDAQIDRLFSMLDRHGRLQLEVGVLQRAPKKISGSFVNSDGTVTVFDWTEEQDQLLNELSGFAKVIDHVDEHAG